MGIPEVDGGYKLPEAIYKVRKGDTLTTISKATGIPISVLVKDNNLEENPDLIVTGQTLVFNYHPEDWETINGPEMNEMYPYHADQVRFFEEMDKAIQARYDAIVKDGAQAHIDTKW